MLWMSHFRRRSLLTSPGPRMIVEKKEGILMTIGRLEEAPPRDLWPNEAYDFTTWLSENLEQLGESIGIELTLVETEASAGAFSADIFAEDGSGNTIVIENQLERTDHDHLGKLITYLSNLGAKVAIWITPDPESSMNKPSIG